MTRPARRRLPRAALACLIACALARSTPPAPAQELPPGRQVTIFGVLATPIQGQGQGQDDPKLKDVLPQLKALLPGHRFKLRKVESKRVAVGESVSCDLGDGFVATSQLVNPLDLNGKVQLRFDFSAGGFPQYQTVVSTPPNQVFYVNRMLANNDRLIVGIGAR